MISVTVNSCMCKKNSLRSQLCLITRWYSRKMSVYPTVYVIYCILLQQNIIIIIVSSV